MQRTISLSFCISDNYARHLAVVVASILHNNPPENCFCFHVLNKDLSETNQARLRTMETQWPGRCLFIFHTIDRSHFDAFPLPLEHITQEMYYRYLLPEILSDENRTIYMDVDILVLGDLRSLWEWPLGACLMGGVEDGKEDSPGFRIYKRRLGMAEDADYFCSGILLMDLARLRAEGFVAKCMENTRLHCAHLAWPDQDVINLTLEGRIAALPKRFNCMTPMRTRKDASIVIRHFASFSSKPWCYLWKNRTWPGYLRYLLKTPYHTEAMGFVWAHLRGFFFYRYTKKGMDRILICGILVWKRCVVPNNAGKDNT